MKGRSQVMVEEIDRGTGRWKTRDMTGRGKE